MDIARTDQLLAEVAQATRARLTSALDTGALDRPDSDFNERLIAATSQILVEALVRHHELLWPSSHRVPDEPATLCFNDVNFSIVVRPDMWDSRVLELAYVPPSGAQRVESAFSNDYSLKGTNRYSIVRIFPPRAEFAFEFQVATVTKIVQTVLSAAETWLAEQRGDS